jgi:hypothetical protein
MSLPSWLQKFIDWVKSLIKKPDPTPTPNPDPGTINTIPVQTPFMLYGLVNTWMKLSSTDMETWMKAQNAAKLDGIMIEFFGYSEDAWEKNLDKLKAQFLVLLPLARKYGQRIWCVLVNWGDENIKAQSDAWIQDILTWFKANTKPDDFVGFEMAAEWSDSQGQRWCGLAETTLAGYPLGWNKGSRPTSADSKYTAIDYHCASTTDIPTNDKRLFIDCDHSTTISQLSDSGVTSEKFSPTKVSAWATNVFKNNKMSVGLYGYGHKVADTASITALGKVRGTVTPDPAPSTGTPEYVSMTGNKMVKWSDLKETCTATLVSGSASGYALSYTESPTWSSADGMTDGYICSTWVNNGKQIAYYWDCKARQSPYTYVSLHHFSDDGSPIQSVRPKNGDAMGIFFVDQTFTNRSSIAATKYYGN